MLMVSQDFPPAVGGIQTYALELARRFAQRCAAFHVVCPAARSHFDDLALGFPVHRVASSSDLLPVLAAPRIARLVARERIDVLFHVQWQTSPVGAWLRARGGVDKLVVAAHGKELLLRPLSRFASLQRHYDSLRARVLSRADVVCPVSHFTDQLLRTHVRSNVASVVVPNGVDAARLAHGDGARFRTAHGLVDAQLLLSVGRLVPRKGVDSVIRGLPRLLPFWPRLHYVVVGSGPDSRRLQTLVQTLGLEARVHFVGQLDDEALRDAYAASELVVLAARDEPDSVEGFGLVLREAAACGKPTLGTRAGGVAEAIDHGVTGLLVPPDDEAALCAGISQLLATPSLARALGTAGRRHALGEGSWDRTAELILQAISGEQRAPRLRAGAELGQEQDLA